MKLREKLGTPVLNRSWGISSPGRKASQRNWTTEFQANSATLRPRPGRCPVQEIMGFVDQTLEEQGTG